MQELNRPRRAEPYTAVLTDLYPNVPAWKQLVQRSGGLIGFEARPVDALAPPPGLSGLRTMFLSFHHFQPAHARAIIADAVRQGQPLAIFELTSRHLWSLLVTALV